MSEIEFSEQDARRFCDAAGMEYEELDEPGRRYAAVRGRLLHLFESPLFDDDEDER